MITSESSPEFWGNSLLWVHTLWKRRPPDFLLAQWTFSSFFKHSLSRETAVHFHICTAAAQSAISLCWPSLPLQWVLWLISPTSIRDIFFSHNSLSPDYFFFLFIFLHSKCLAYLCMYLFMHCVIFSRKSLNNTNTGNVNEHIEFVMLNLPLQSASVLLCLPETRELDHIILPNETSHRWINVWLTCKICIQFIFNWLPETFIHRSLSEQYIL